MMVRREVSRLAGMVAACGVALFVTQSALGAILVGNGTYTQNFDGLAHEADGPLPWVDDVTVPGWYAANPSGHVTEYRVGNGSSSVAGIYSFGSTGESDRALGTKTTNSGTGQVIGMLVHNNTTAKLLSIDLEFAAERWRRAPAATETSAFYFMTSDTLPADDVLPDLVLSIEFWTADPTFNIESGEFGSAGALDGNIPPNRVLIGGTLVFPTPLAPGAYVWLAWSDPTPYNHGLAIDDLTMSFNLSATGVTTAPEPSSIALYFTAIAIGACAAARKRRKRG